MKKLIPKCQTNSGNAFGTLPNDATRVDNTDIQIKADHDLYQQQLTA